MRWPATAGGGTGAIGAAAGRGHWYVSATTGRPVGGGRAGAIGTAVGDDVELPDDGVLPAASLEASDVVSDWGSCIGASSGSSLGVICAPPEC
ncbi:hypothetical protein GCM10027053_32550 [Intrasporangium mesophilum]